MAGISSKGAGVLEYKKGYNGNEIQKREFSDGSGLEVYDFNARTYDHQIGRFIQIDPLVEFGSQESLTPYQFSYDNPIRYNDPDGRCPCLIPALPALGELIIAGGTAIVGYFATKHIVENAPKVNIPKIRVNNFPAPNGNSFVPISAQVAQKKYQQSETNASKKQAGSTTSNTSSGNNNQGPEPNGGNAKKHGGNDHNTAIDNKVNELNNDGNVINIRKNQQQVDATGKKVGTNRPDVQYDRYNEKTGKWEHHVVEYDTKPAASTAHGKTILAKDPKAIVKLNVLE